MSEYTILIADDHPLLRSAVVQSLRQSLPLAQVREVARAEALAEALDAHPDVDLVLLDLTMPGAHGFSALLHVRGSHPDIPVVILSSNDHPRVIRRAQQFGAAGFIPKSAPAETIGEAVQAVLDGGLWFPAMAAERSEADALLASRLAQLTPQQFRVLQMLGAGRLNKQIAYDLNVSEATIKAHVTAILRKLGVTNRTQAVLMAGKLAIDDAAIVLPPEED
ncbi:hypothetical protein G6F68_012169 [Rhizopus microsporus]|nr:hypothetical protein G6F68_012169 [Rhizopus microsporus]